MIQDVNSLKAMIGECSKSKAYLEKTVEKYQTAERSRVARFDKSWELMEWAKQH